MRRFDIRGRAAGLKKKKKKKKKPGWIGAKLLGIFGTREREREWEKVMLLLLIDEVACCWRGKKRKGI
jgi:hypothetical protein